MSITRRKFLEAGGLGVALGVAGYSLSQDTEIPQKNTKLTLSIGPFQFGYHGLRGEFRGDRFTVGFYPTYDRAPGGVVRDVGGEPLGVLSKVVLVSGGHDLANYRRDYEQRDFSGLPKLGGGISIDKHPYDVSFKGRVVFFSVDERNNVSMRTVLASEFSRGRVDMGTTEVTIGDAWEVQGNKALPLTKPGETYSQIIAQGNQPGVIAALYEQIPFRGIQPS